MKQASALQTIKIKLDSGKRITLKDILLAILLLDHRTDFANGALANLWRGLIDKYGNALKAQPKRTIGKTLLIVYIVHPYIIEIAGDVAKHHKESPILEKALLFFGV